MEITHLLSFSVLILLSIQTVNSLKCATCNNPTCDSYKTIECPAISGAACQSFSFMIGDVKTVSKGCSSLDVCKIRPSIVPQGAKYDISCCETDVCNSAITTKMSLFLAGFLVLMSLGVSRF